MAREGSRRVLVLTPYLPWPPTGACQQDRVAGIEQLRSFGCEVEVIAKIDRHHEQVLTELQQRLPYRVTGVPYRRAQSFSRWQRFCWQARRLVLPRYLDGAAYEYADPLYVETVRATLERFRPEIVWVDYTYLWAVYPLLRSYGVRIVTRSANFEPLHYLEEAGRGLRQYLMYLPKWFGERRAALASDVVCAITPQEAERYRKLGVKQVVTLPLRALPKLLARDPHQDPPLDAQGRVHLFFAGSTYQVAHNAKALQFLLDEVVPLLRERFSAKWVLHIIGGKVPTVVRERYAAEDVRFEGFVEDLDTFLRAMHVAVIPSLAGAGMQQKLFEPLTRGFPVITHARALAGYSFVPEREVVCAQDAAGFVEAIQRLASNQARQTLGQAARTKANELFSEQRVMECIRQALVAHS